MSNEPSKPSEPLVQQLLAERRELKVAIERLRLEVEEARRAAGGTDPRIKEMQGEIERLRYQLASARAEATQLRDERDTLRGAVSRAIAMIAAEAGE